MKILPEDKKYRKRSLKNYIDKSSKPTIEVYDLIYKLLDVSKDGSTVDQECFDKVDKLLK
jgi:hypothetical protein